jgi:TusA-related sulfurtransferase
MENKNMARGKAISVKIATPKVIKALEASLAKLEADYTNQEANEAKYNKAMEKWRKEVAKFAIDRFSKAENLRTNYRSWNNTLNVDFDLTVSEKDFPKEPERDYVTLHQHSYNEQKQEIENAIRILKMTDEEVVNTSTYNAVARYL